MKQTFVVVGAGLAGAKAVQTLREAGFDGRILLIGAEAERPYERPPLSKGYLAGTAPRESVFVHEAAWYAEHDVDLRSGVSVGAIDVAIHRLRQRFGVLLRQQVAQTVSSETEIEEEIRHLIAVLSG